MWGRVTAYIIGGHSCQAEKEARGAGTGGGEHLPHTAPLGLDPQPSLGADPGLGCSACSLDSCHGAVSPGTRSGARTGCPSLRVVRVGQLGTPRNLQPQVCSVVRWGSQGPGKQWETWPGTQGPRRGSAGRPSTPRNVPGGGACAEGAPTGSLVTRVPADCRSVLQHGHDRADLAEAGPPGPRPVRLSHVSLPVPPRLGPGPQGCLSSGQAMSGRHAPQKPGLCPLGGTQHGDPPRALSEAQSISDTIASLVTSL